MDRAQYLAAAERADAVKSADERVVAAAAAGVGFAEYLAAGPALMQRWLLEGNQLVERQR
jgi:hypothetical protein